MLKEYQRIESFIAERTLKCLKQDMQRDIRKLDKEKGQEQRVLLEDYIDLAQFYLLCALAAGDMTVLMNRKQLKYGFEKLVHSNANSV